MLFKLLHVLFYGIDYKCITDIIFNKGITIVSHDYSIVDAMIIANEVKKQKINEDIYIVVDNRFYLRMLLMYYRLLGYSHIHFLYTGENCVKKMKQVLKENKFLVIFSPRTNKHSGIYNVVKDPRMTGGAGLIKLIKIKKIRKKFEKHEINQLISGDISMNTFVELSKIVVEKYKVEMTEIEPNHKDMTNNESFLHNLHSQLYS